MSDVTVILSVYKRPQLYHSLLEQVRQQSHQPAAVWTLVTPIDSEADIRDDARAIVADSQADRVVTCSPNPRMHFRCLLALDAPTKFVLLLDDDLVMGVNWIANCVRTFETLEAVGRDGILCAHGAIQHSPTNYFDRDLYGSLKATEELTRVDWGGHAYFFRPAWASYLFAEPYRRAALADDLHLCFRAARLGGIPTYVPRQPAADLSLWGNHDSQRHGVDDAAVSLRPGFQAERMEIFREEIAKGYRPLSPKIRHTVS